MKNYYAVLQVLSNAPQEEIEAAYRKKVKFWGPRVSQNPKYAEIYAQVEEAYSVLRISSSRTLYDERLLDAKFEKYVGFTPEEYLLR
jgi:curved DNA-binding protein CbpA